MDRNQELLSNQHSGDPVSLLAKDLAFKYNYTLKENKCHHDCQSALISEWKHDMTYHHDALKNERFNVKKKIAVQNLKYHY